MDTCENCGNKIDVQIFKGGRWCSDRCRKALGADATGGMERRSPVPPHADVPAVVNVKVTDPRGIR